MLNEGQNYYEILDIKPDATTNEVRQAYYRVKSAYSKDSAALYSLFDEQETKAILGLLEEAYIILSNPEKRKEYDKVHGFLTPQSFSISPKTSSVSFEKGTFSFAEPSAAPIEKNIAEQTAQSIFGDNGSMSTFGDVSTETLPKSKARKEPPVAEEKPAPVRDMFSEVEDYSNKKSSETSFQYKENRLGIVRRVDLVKEFQKNEEMEQAILAEKEFRGEFLKKIREYRKISVDELSDYTKISKAYLNCIEAEEFENLPAPAYLRGFVIQVAKALKIPYEAAANGYMLHYKNTVLK